MTTPQTIGECVSRLEGGQEHLATKADVESVKVEVERVRVEVESVKVEVESVKVEMERLRADLRAEIKDSKISTIIWLTGVMVLVSSAQVAAGVAFFRMLSG